MNPSQSQQGPQAGQQQGQQLTPYHGLIKADTIRTLPFLTPEEKEKYAKGTADFWAKLQNTPRESTEHQQILGKLRQLTNTFMGRMKQHREKQAQEQQASGGNAQQQPPANAAQRPQSQGQQIQQGQGIPQQQQQQQTSQQQPQNQGQGGAQPSMAPLIEKYQQQAEGIPWIAPPQMDPAGPDAQRWKEETKKRYAERKATADYMKAQLQRAEGQMQQLRSQGKTIPPGWGEQKQKAEAKLADATRFLEELQRQQNANSNTTNRNQNNQQSQQQAMSQPQQGAQQGNNGRPQGQTQPQLQANNSNIQQQSQIRPGTGQGQGVPQNMGQTPQQQSQQTPQQQQGNFPNQAGQQQQAQNTAQAQYQNAVNRSQASNQSPQSAVAPQSATNLQQPQQSGPVPYTHQQAVAAASASRSFESPSQPQSQTGTAQQTGGIGSQSTTAPPVSATAMHPSGLPPSTTNPPTPASALQKQEQVASAEKRNNLQNMPIRRDFTPPHPTPTSMPPGRPTITGAGSSGSVGMMGQPAISKPPGWSLNGTPGERVLDRKRLDELARQVCGGAVVAEGSTDGETSLLQPEVEESILNLADEFIENVITSACKLAKLRSSSSSTGASGSSSSAKDGQATLELRDIQLVLERQYNMRIPGYATDEVRTVHTRKAQPATAYLQKMNAVQAAKVMGGKGGE